MVTRREMLGVATAAWLETTRGAGWGAGETSLQGSAPLRASEILIRGGRVVNADGVREADVRIVGETIAEVGRGLEAGETARIVDASGHFVMPGGIDPHTHLSPPFADDITSGSAAALAGGITTLGTFAWPREGENALDAMDRVEVAVAAEAIVDVFLHANTWPPTVEYAAMMPALAQRGQPSLKVFMARPDFAAHVAVLMQVLEAARDAGVVTLIHCEDGALLEAVARRLEAAGKTSLRHYAESRPVEVEVTATRQAAAWCERTRAPMYVVHLSAAAALEACRTVRNASAPLFVETRPLYLHFTDERLAGPEGPLFIGQPPLRSAADAEALWTGLAGGDIDVLATDHAPWTRDQKLDPDLSISNLRPGVSDLEFMLPLYFSEGILRGRISLSRFVETTSTNAARIFGLFPRKGVIREGALADVAVWDPERTRAIAGSRQRSRVDYSVYEGWEVTGWPVMTIRRGEIVFDHGATVGKPGSGKVLARRPWRG